MLATFLDLSRTRCYGSGRLLGLVSDLLPQVKSDNPFNNVFLSYTTFYILYPIGAPSEAFLMFSTLPVTLFPPRYNLGSFTLSNWIVLVLYAVWWPCRSLFHFGRSETC